MGGQLLLAITLQRTCGLLSTGTDTRAQSQQQMFGDTVASQSRKSADKAAAATLSALQQA